MANAKMSMYNEGRSYIYNKAYYEAFIAEPVYAGPAFFEKEKFNNIVEIGTGWGKFSLYLAKKSKEMSAEFITFDIRDISEDIKNQLVQLGGIFYNEDVNKSNKIEDMVSSAGRVLILNDGALKTPQFKRLAPVLKQTDFILTHDYYVGQKEPASGGISLGEVTQEIIDNNLEVCYKDLFDYYLWLCCVKRVKK